MKNKTLLVIPFRNKEKELISIMDFFKKHVEKIDFIFINNSSNDRSEEILKLNNVSYLSSIFKVSYNKCLKIGLEYARLSNYEYIIEYGDINFFSPKNVIDLLNVFENIKPDLLLANGIFSKKFSFFLTKEKILSFFSFLITGKKIKGLTSRLKIFNKEILKYINKRPNYGLRPDDIVLFALNKKTVKSFSLQVEKQGKRKNLKKFLSSIKEIFIWILFIIFVVPFRKKSITKKIKKERS